MQLSILQLAMRFKKKQSNLPQNNKSRLASSGNDPSLCLLYAQRILLENTIHLARIDRIGI
jgi:hypothetical protein